MAYIYSNTDKTVRMLAQASGTESRDTGSNDAPIPGDQIAHELDAVGYYQHSVRWGKLYRLNDEAQREILAKFMEDSILNGWVGYDTNHRNTFELALEDVQYDPNRIAWACMTDCSMLAYEAVKAATGVDLNSYADPLYYIGKYPHVRSFDYYMERILPLSGVKVTVYTVSNYLNGAIRRSGTIVAGAGSRSTAGIRSVRRRGDCGEPDRAYRGAVSELSHQLGEPDPRRYPPYPVTGSDRRPRPHRGLDLRRRDDAK